jgi:hypothetical protein
MSFVVTEGSQVQCTHVGSVQLRAGQSKLVVAGSGALVDGDLAGAMISGCITVPDPNTTTTKCLTVSSVENGVATKLTVGGKGVVLDSIQGNTSGTVGGVTQRWSVLSAAQTKLKAV